MPEPLQGQYQPHVIEAKWQRTWEEWGIYRFNRGDTARPAYSIDTPPPYPSGNFHMGNVLNWVYFDMVARYKRMDGYNVLFPQGWDCHGLPTEVQVEHECGIRRSSVPPDEFIALCKKYVDRYVHVMKEAIVNLGCSIDWTTEFKTMDPGYWRKTQLSFLIMYKKGLVYRGKHPVNWCPRCETAIADAEVEYDARRGKLHYITFNLAEGGVLKIATTRPELLPACVAVAVHPGDEGYKRYIGCEVIVPLFNRRVRILDDEGVDPNFGTGVVMICTYGDKTDVKWVAKYGFKVVECLDERGYMTQAAGKYAGLSVEDCRVRIVEDLKNAGMLDKEEAIEQKIGRCWRCDNPVEILERNQWFMNVRALTDAVVKNTLEVKWVPDHMKWHQVNWAKSLDWDWVISRQRIFATPIPVWYCKGCGEVVPAEESWLPIDPRLEKPKVVICPKCGLGDFTPETGVFDTWMDSSISCAVYAGWPDSSDWRRLFPADLHPSGMDIIRTWAYYLMVRHLAIFDEKPYKTCLINGMVLGSDGRKMSKHLGNFVTAPEVLEKYCADAMRQWAAAGGVTGSDIPFRWEDVDYAWRFLIKLWNASRFVSIQLKDYQPSSDEAQLRLLDRWLLSKLEGLAKTVTEAFENFQFNIAVEALRNFVWHIFCDHYLEVIKYRLYQPDVRDGEDRLAAQQVMDKALLRILRFLAPVCPYITEEIYQSIQAEDKGYRSIHVSPWPKPRLELIDEEVEKQGDVAVAVIAEIRRAKARSRKPLSASIKEVVIYAGDAVETLEKTRDDIVGTCKIEGLKILMQKSAEGISVEGYPDIHIILTL